MERKLVELARHGDREAFGELAVALGDRLHAVAHRILRDRDLAGDATQEALVKIWRELPRLRDVERFDGWAYRVLVNACHDQIRRRRPRSVDLLDFDGSLPDASAAVADRDQLERAFARLSADHRAVVITHLPLAGSIPLSIPSNDSWFARQVHNACPRRAISVLGKRGLL